MEQPKSGQRPLLVVAGPTASGKTAAGIYLCQRLGGEVVSADSMQIYRQLQVGTAKPTLEERQGVPHHLMDFLSPSQPFSVAEYVEQAHRVMEEIYRRGRLPVVVGGTGLYISSLVDNIRFAQTQADPQLRRRLEELAAQEGAQTLWERLRQVDPESAQRIHPNNLGRVIRALEVWETTGKTMSQLREESRSTPSPYRPCMMALGFRHREELYRRINRRAEGMLQSGLLEEARWLMDQPDAPTAAQAIGYKEMIGYLRGEETLEEASERLCQESRRYAKRQLTWFGRDPRYRWFWVDEYREPAHLLEDMEAYVRHFLTVETEKFPLPPL